jgi:hypothetical protein
MARPPFALGPCRCPPQGKVDHAVRSAQRLHRTTTGQLSVRVCGGASMDCLWCAAVAARAQDVDLSLLVWVCGTTDWPEISSAHA